MKSGQLIADILGGKSAYPILENNICRFLRNVIGDDDDDDEDHGTSASIELVNYAKAWITTWW